ncbi:hypothetical protein O3P69_020324 [Scylla paramamosain]|uniref:Wbp11/ELF5/Saf1 N-terminal domain-containing protein n=1 Tax=Scylla paramamosain TaxID=85552 RepID=A0AAW0SKF2_SCYPA
MGRRSINTTKSGKYMNPTDQARKEARKRELKKNKKQRQMVRAAVLKGKDPSQIIMEMEKIDNMEYNVDVPPALSEKVLKDKRKKLRETLDRVLKLYERENPEYWVEIRRMEGDYEKKRLALIEYFDSVRHAQAVTVDEIPLPNLDMPPAPPDAEGTPTPAPDPAPAPHARPVPNAHLVPSHSILKKMSAYAAEPRRPPGCPPTLPPELSDGEEEEAMEADGPGEVEAREEDGEGEAPRSRTIRFEDGDDGLGGGEEKDTRATVASSKGLTSLQTKLLQMSGQDIDDFMRETEVLFREKAAERRADLRARLDKLDDDPPTAPRPPGPPHQPPLLSMPPPLPATLPPTGHAPVSAPSQQPPPLPPTCPQGPRCLHGGGSRGAPNVGQVGLGGCPRSGSGRPPSSMPLVPPGVAQVPQPGQAVPVNPPPRGPSASPPWCPQVAPPSVPQVAPTPHWPSQCSTTHVPPPTPPMRTNLPPPPGVRPPPNPLPQGMPPKAAKHAHASTHAPRPLSAPQASPPGLPPRPTPPRPAPPAQPQRAVSRPAAHRPAQGRRQEALGHHRSQAADQEPKCRRDPFPAHSAACQEGGQEKDWENTDRCQGAARRKG